MEYTTISQPHDTRLVLSGQFTFSDNMKFKQILEMVDSADTRALTLDFAGVDFIDSAGLGMLLLLRDECQLRNVTLAIAGAQGQVKKIFMISKFDQLFAMPPEGSNAPRH